jgi:hypothetical protein
MGFDLKAFVQIPLAMWGYPVYTPPLLLGVFPMPGVIPCGRQGSRVI